MQRCVFTIMGSAHNHMIQLSMQAFNGHVGVATYLLEQGATVDRPMSNGATPIFAAAQQGNVHVLDALLSARAVRLSFPVPLSSVRVECVSSDWMV